MIAVRKIARGVGKIELQDVPQPHPGPGQVVIEVNSAGICGTDLHIYLDEFETRPPVTIGHELAGVIVESGRDVDAWKVGDRVTTETYFSTCGCCLDCRRGRRNLCLHRRSIGSKEEGAFAQYLLTPASNLHRVPDGLDLESAALTEPLACTVHGVLDTAGVRAGENVALTGPGPIGLLALQLVKVAGATAVMIGTRLDTQRLKLAKELGADGVINVEEVDNIVEAVGEFFGTGTADLVVECSGAAAAAKTLVDLASRGARFCQMGLYGKPITFNQDAVCYKELVVTGTNASVTSAWPKSLKLLVQKQVDASRLITHRFPLTEWDQALEVVKRKEGVKVLLKPGQD
ncbi:MAG: zinc-binding dehydrogenase [Verrucomicrobia bacterium]|nr:zinc-binding dehydrogenase [Verrucomicrobiota bacterium]